LRLVASLFERYGTFKLQQQPFNALREKFKYVPLPPVLRRVLRRDTVDVANSERRKMAYNVVRVVWVVWARWWFYPIHAILAALAPE